jgi:hypothetical protein
MLSEYKLSNNKIHIQLPLYMCKESPVMFSQVTQFNDEFGEYTLRVGNAVFYNIGVPYMLNGIGILLTVNNKGHAGHVYSCFLWGEHIVDGMVLDSRDMEYTIESLTSIIAHYDVLHKSIKYVFEQISGSIVPAEYTEGSDISSPA